MTQQGPAARGEVTTAGWEWWGPAWKGEGKRERGRRPWGGGTPIAHRIGALRGGRRDPRTGGEVPSEQVAPILETVADSWRRLYRKPGFPEIQPEHL